MISDEEALKKLTADCDKCPNCGSDDLSVGDYEGDGLNAASSCHCNDCGMEWTEEYKLYSVTITKGPDYGEVDEPDEPQEEDLVTEDHQRFFRFGMNDRRPVVQVPEDEDWRIHVKAYVDRTMYWPNVWFISDHGNAHLLSLEDK